MAKKYTKSHSNYILKSNPIATNSGVIYENDLLTYVDSYNYINNNLTTRTKGGFTFITNTEPSKKKSYSNGGFSEFYTLDDLLTSQSNNVINNKVKTVALTPEPTYINIKKSFIDISKFCYFGSTNKYIQSAIEDIINRFPASIYIPNHAVINGNTTNTITIPIVEVSNPFGLDLLDYTFDRLLMEYDIKKLATSYLDYILVNNVDEQLASVTGFTATNTNIVLIFDKIVNIETSFHIKPSIKKQNDFFDSLDGLQDTLLNRKSSPKYKSSFKTEEETELGITKKFKDFIWNTYDGHNLDITSTDYSLFVQYLIDSSNYADEKHSDVIYRMLTHDSIKNMDTTYQRIVDQDLLDEYIAGGTKIQSLLRLYGRCYDDIKDYAEGIAFTNNITYNKINNLPEIYLSKKINSLGWELETLTNILPLDNTSSKLYDGIIGSYDTNEVVNEINRRLILSSKSIVKSKGTVKAIRKVLGLLGIDERIYEIREYVQEVGDYISGDKLENIIDLNQNLRAVEIENLFGNGNVLAKDILLTGLNIGTITISGATYGYPKPRVNSKNFYFQQMGGWYKETGGSHTDLNNTNYVNNTTTGNNPHTGNGNYDYGFDYIDQFTNLFKSDILKQNNHPNINVNDYSNIGFDTNKTKTIDNRKVSFIGVTNPSTIYDTIVNDLNEAILTDSGEPIYVEIENNNANIMGDNRLKINLKNFVIGINAVKALEIFRNKTLRDELGQPILTDTGEFIYADVVTETTKEDVFNFIKKLVLPYVEQIIPSTTIFDFIMIDKNTPKWVLVDKYCGRTNDSNQNFNGQTILRYKNMNYFDETSTDYTNELTEIIKNNFGNVFTQIPTPKDKIIGFGREILFTGDNGSCQRDRTPNWIVDTGLNNYLEI